MKVEYITQAGTPAGDLVVFLDKSVFMMNEFEMFVHHGDDREAAADWENWECGLLSSDNPKNAYVFQGDVIFYNPLTKELVKTSDSECVNVQDCAGFVSVNSFSEIELLN